MHNFLAGPSGTANCTGRVGNTGNPNTSGSSWASVGWFWSFNHMYINLYRRRDLTSSQYDPGYLGVCEGPLYTSAGKMAPTGIYRVPEHVSNFVGGSYGKSYCFMDWNLETMTLNRTWC